MCIRDRYNDMQERWDKLYDEITDIEDAMEEVETRLYNIRQDKICLLYTSRCV